MHNYKFYAATKAVDFADNDRKMAIVSCIVVAILGIRLKWYDFYIMKWILLIGTSLRFIRLIPMLIHLFVLWAQADKTEEYKEYKEFICSYVCGDINEDEKEEPLRWGSFFMVKF